MKQEASSKPAFDVVGIGCIAVDEMIMVDSYPQADAKAPVKRWERRCGGLVATALVAAARLGSHCGYVSVLGNDELSTYARDSLCAEGIDVERVIRDKAARPIHSIIVVGEDRGTRNIFYDFNGMVDPPASLLDADMVRSTRVLLIDHYGSAGKVAAVRLAREARVPVVADFEASDTPRFAELLKEVDHLILSREFARKLGGDTDPSLLARKFWNKHRQAVVITCGAEGSWFISSQEPDQVRHVPAHTVQVIDTTGCGDVFHGAYASALARGEKVEDCLRWATAAASLKATRPGAQAGAPRRHEVENFLHQSKPNKQQTTTT